MAIFPNETFRKVFYSLFLFLFLLCPHIVRIETAYCADSIRISCGLTRFLSAYRALHSAFCALQSAYCADRLNPAIQCLVNVRLCLP